MDAFGWFIATSHHLLGHDQTAALIRQPPGNREDCLICQYEHDPTEERKQAVLRALSLDDIPVSDAGWLGPSDEMVVIRREADRDDG
jgi:hypothetical protein